MLTIANNTLMSNGDGILGVLALLLGIFEGTDSALKVVNGLGQEVEAIAGFVPWRSQNQQ